VAFGSASLLVLSLATVTYAGTQYSPHRDSTPKIDSKSSGQAGFNFPSPDTSLDFAPLAPSVPLSTASLPLPQVPDVSRSAILQPVELTMRADEKAYKVQQQKIRRARALKVAKEKALKAKELKLKEKKAKAQEIAYKRQWTQPVSRSVSLSSLSGSTTTRAAEVALRYVGVPYSWGGSSPSGFDCSGLVAYAYSQVNVSMPHSSYAMYNMGSPVSQANLSTGDLVFFDTDGAGASHVGIYLGGGQFVDASGSHVQVNSLSGYWASHYIGARRP